jgi:hypothetical protein
VSAPHSLREASSATQPRNRETVTWLVLIYTVPAEPSRARATVWREIKKAGAVYIRDGCCALPEQEGTLRTFRTIANTVEELGGRATLARSVELDDEKSQVILDEARQARSAEYADLERELNGFIVHVRQERAHREFRFSELELLDADLAKLRRWYGQIAGRDFTDSHKGFEIQRILDECESELRTALEDAFKREPALN